MHSILQNDEEMMENSSIGDSQEVNEKDLVNSNIWNSDLQNSIIHSTTDFYHLVEGFFMLS